MKENNNARILKQINKSTEKKHMFKKINESKIWLLIPIVIGLVVAILGFKSYFGYHEVSQKDLVTINGCLDRYNYNKVGKNTELNIKLKEYPVTFNIWSIPLIALNKEQFEEDIKSGGKIELLILKDNINDLNTTKNKVNIYGVSSKNNNYLNFNDLNKEERSNATVGLIIAFIFLGLIIFLIVIYCKLT